MGRSVSVTTHINHRVCVLEASDQAPGEGPEVSTAFGGGAAGLNVLVPRMLHPQETQEARALHVVHPSKVSLLKGDDNMAPRMLVPNPECFQPPRARRTNPASLLLARELLLTSKLLRSNW